MMKTTRALAMVGMATLLLATGARMAAEPSSTPRLDWLFNGDVFSTARIGNTVYVGGSFTSLTPASGVLSRLLMMSPTTGAPIGGLPFVNGEVHTIAPDGTGGYYAYGSFTNIGSMGPRYGGFPSLARLAHVLANGSNDPALQPQFGGSLRRMIRVGPSLVAAGDLFVDNGTTARALLAVNPVTGALSSWVPAVPGTVDDLAASNDVLFVLATDPLANRRVMAFDSATGDLLWTSAVVANPTGGNTPPLGRLIVAGGRVVVGLNRLYSLHPSTGAIDPAWGGPAGPANSIVGAMSASATAIYVGGSFATFHGQTRNNLAAVDLATGAVLPWNPQASLPIGILQVSAAGTVFLGPQATSQTFTVGGQSRARLAEVDTAGAVTAWVPQASISPNALAVAVNGTLVIASAGVPVTGTQVRPGLAAFDATTGALLPEDIVTVSPASVPAGSGVLAVGQTLYLVGTFNTVNGSARANMAAVDVPSNTVLPWPAAGVSSIRLAFADGPWVYGITAQDAWRRIHAISGILDPVWRSAPPMYWTMQVVPSAGELLAAMQGPLDLAPRPTLVGTLHPVTGAFIERFRSTAVAAGMLTVDGDTIYLGEPGQGLRSIVGGIRGFHRFTGVPVSVPPVTGVLNGLAVADGRLFAFGGQLAVGATQRLGLAELIRPSGVTAFEAGVWAPDGGLRLSERGVFAARAHGDLLIAFGLGDSFIRVAGFPLSGASVPSNLRSQTSGPNTIFTWDAMVPPPAGGYVIEGGFAAGQAAGALAVGNTTSVALPMPPGPAFIRVRPQGGTEVSNEIVAGCFAPPLPPTALTTSMNGTNLSLAWTAPTAEVTSFTFLAGTTAGSSNAATVALPGTQTSMGGTVPGGTFFARVTATNACGTSGPSGEVFFTIGAPDPLPAAPTNLAATVSGSTVSLTWTAPAGAVTSYVLEAGTGAGLANLGTLSIGATPSLVVPGVPAGTYVLRVRAITSAGSGAPSADVVVVVP